MRVDHAAATALATIRRCVRLDRVVLLPHFRERLAIRGLLWTDVLTVLDAPRRVEDGGLEERGRPKWIIAGDGVDGQPLECVCVLDRDASGNVTVFVTVY
jgi:hypothetical protein